MEEIPYDFELEKLSAALKGSRRVLIQLPDGLKHYSSYIAGYLSGSLPETEVVFSMGGNYGGCDLDISEANLIGADTLVNIGHTPYSLQEVPLEYGSLKILFVPAYYRGKISEESLEQLVSKLREAGSKQPSLVATVQHIKQLDIVKDELKRRGFSPIVATPGKLLPGQIIGCDYSSIALSKGSDSVVVISGGLFHSLGASMVFKGPVFQLDPYTGRVIDLSAEREKWLKRRLAEMYRALDSKSWGIVIGTLSGQYRPSIIEKLKREISSRGMKYYLFASRVLSRESILNIDSDDIDAYIVTSCPRIPIDDFTESPLPKPILTPGEAFSVLEGKMEVYRFLW